MKLSSITFCLVILICLSLSVLAAPRRQRPRKQAVAGGENVAANEFPHLVSLQYSPSAGRAPQHFCGASIISKRWLITAAHCVAVDGMDATKIRVVAGTNNKDANCAQSNSGCVVRSVSRAISHPNYNKDYIRNDLALIELTADLPYGQNIKPIALEGGSIPWETVLTVAGWGLTRDGSQNLPTIAQKGYLPLRSSSVCNAQRLDMQSPWQLCAGEGRGINSCQGDSGGPLFWKRQSSQNPSDVVMGLAGLVSYGPQGCGRQGSFSVYTNATYWINYVKNYVSDINIVYYSNPSTPSPSPSQPCVCQQQSETRADSNTTPIPHPIPNEEAPNNADEVMPPHQEPNLVESAT
ncbi:hypothetical protein C9374_006881 [Naegleria lovaniensis]|uniref:Peptidase S1 domain-containing protein n=1 Tax=Naegleria lovaniensis TaxID=51637 RepID=A0AA88GYK8_NAELO|nr:uncharacterized protein C9374_006881 [Naegleria lovaniensis]KAG2393350.1 hypothetical protein C9374_006881 [Naegleria lovaniensis]